MKKFSPDAEILNSIIRVGFTRNLILFLVFFKKNNSLSIQKIFFFNFKKNFNFFREFNCEAKLPINFFFCQSVCLSVRLSQLFV